MSYFTGNGSDTGSLNRSKRSYLSVASFETAFFTYTVAMNTTTYVNTGTLTTVSGATAANCPKGRVLRENGKKLFPDANPGITNYMVGVYDSITGFSGFIDPNGPVFTMYNSDKPTYLADTVGPDGRTAAKAPPVFTDGTIEAASTIKAGTGGFIVPVTVGAGAVALAVSTSLAAGFNWVGPAAAVSGICLPSTFTAFAGTAATVKNFTGFALSVFPNPATANINSGTGVTNALVAGQPAVLGSGTGATFFLLSTNSWYVEQVAA
jgi:hypothetical protein